MQHVSGLYSGKMYMSSMSEYRKACINDHQQVYIQKEDLLFE